MVLLIAMAVLKNAVELKY